MSLPLPRCTTARLAPVRIAAALVILWPLSVLAQPLPPADPPPPARWSAPHVPLPPVPPRPRRRAAAWSADLYEQAQHAIQEGRYDHAIDHLDRLIERFEGESRTQALANRVDAALYWKAYAQMKQKEIAEALATLDALQRRFRTSRWVRAARALEVEARQATGQPVAPEAQADAEIKLLALGGLMRRDPDRAVPMIEALLEGAGSEDVKANALFVLSQSRSARARAVITDVAKSGDNPDLQLKAVRYLGVMGGAENRRVLEEVYRRTSDLGVKRAVIRSLLPARDRARLLSMARSESLPELRGEAIQQLGAVHAAAELSELYRSEPSLDLKRRIIQSLTVSQAADRLFELARDESDEELRRTAVRNLGAMSAAVTGELLRSLYVAESSLTLKTEVVRALALQRNAAVLADLRRDERNPALRREIRAALSSHAHLAPDTPLESAK
jgi:outer membrane protein assembly factor BamD (BamD/ComL family)